MSDDDPMALLEKQAKRQEAEKNLHERIGTARRKLIFDRKADAAFFATLALRLKVTAEWGIDTAGTDGKVLACNPEFIAGLPDAELVGVLAHEVMHNALQHHARRGLRDRRTWNVACDLAVNPILRTGGFTLPSCGVFPGKGDFKDFPEGLSAEEYYSLLQQPAQPPDNKQPGGQEGGKGGDDPGGQPGDDPGGCGGVLPPGDGSEAACQESKAEWEVAVAQAANVAKMRGTVSAGLARLVDQILNPTVDWREALRNFLNRKVRTDYRWCPPNRRFAWQGVYLPGLAGEGLGHVVVAVDTSGSIDAKTLSVFAGEIDGIISAFTDVSLTILYHDAAVCHVQEWNPGDGPLVLEPAGGGGTDHNPVFDWIAKSEQECVALVCLTDLYSSFPKEPPGYPVLWAATTDLKGPWGETVRVRA